MAAELVASLVLKLEDQLGGGLQRLQDQLDRLNALGKALGLPGLDRAKGDALALARQIGEVSSQIYRMQQATREGSAGFESMGRIARAALAGIGSATAGVRERIGEIGGRAHAFGEAGSNLINKGMGAAAEGFAVYEPIKQFADRDVELRQQAIMEGFKGPALIAEMRRISNLVYHDAQANGVEMETALGARKDLIGRMRLELVDPALKVHTEVAKAYNIDPELLGAATGALVTNLKIAPSEDALGGGLAALAMADQHGVFKMQDFAHALPGVTGVAASLGMTGRKTVNELAAALEMSTKMATDPTQAGVNIEDLLSYITSNRENNLASKKEKINMPALLRNAARHGINPFDAFMGELRNLTKGKTPLDQAEVLSSMLTNQQARKGAMAILQNWDEFKQLQAKFGAVTGSKLAGDHAESMNAFDTQMKQLGNSTHQLGVELGAGFAPVLGIVNTGLGMLVDKLMWLNTHFPQTTAYVLGSVAGMLAIGAALTLLGAIWPVFSTGALLAVSVLKLAVPLWSVFATGVRFVVFAVASLTGLSVGAVAAIAALAAVLAGAAIDIYENWGRFRGFFQSLWSSVKEIFQGFVTFVTGVFTGNLSKALAGISGMGAGINGAWRAVWNIVKQVFIDFGHWVDTWTGGLVSGIISRITGAFGQMHAMISRINPASLAGEAVHGFDNSAVGRWLGLSDHPALKPASSAAPAAAPATAPAAPAPPPQRVDIHLHAEPGTAATATTSSDQVTVTAPPRGATTGRP